MAIVDVSLIFSRGLEKTIDNITISAMIRESHQRSAKTTSYPIEDGSNISDHITVDNKRLQISGIIEPEGNGSNIVTAFKTFENLIESKKKFTVVTGLKVYENMVLLSYDVPRQANDGGALNFDMTFEQIVFAKSQTTQIPNAQIGGDAATIQQAQLTQNAGTATSGQTVDVKKELSIIEEADAKLDELFGSAFGAE